MWFQVPSHGSISSAGPSQVRSPLLPTPYASVQPRPITEPVPGFTHVPQPPLPFTEVNACLQNERSETCSNRPFDSRATMKPNFGWFSCIADCHGICTVPGLHMSFCAAHPIVVAVLPSTEMFEMSVRRPLRSEERRVG